MENEKKDIPNIGMKAGDKKLNTKFNIGGFKMKTGNGKINMDKFKMGGQNLRMKTGNLQMKKGSSPFGMKRGSNPLGMQKDKPRFNIPKIKTISLTKQVSKEPQKDEEQPTVKDKEFEEIYNKYDGRYKDLVSAHQEVLKKLRKLEKIINDNE